MKVLILLFVVLYSFPLSIFSQRLNPGDGVRISFFNITDQITGDYFVQEDGFLQLPYIGDIQTSSREFSVVRTLIHQKYDSLYKSPELNIQPLYKIYIFGEVRKPGYYYFTGVEKLSDLIAIAGGETSDADLDDIKLIRNNQNMEVDANSLIKKGSGLSDIGLLSSDQIFVPRKWWVSFRNTTFIVSGIAVLATVVGLFVR